MNRIKSFGIIGVTLLIILGCLALGGWASGRSNKEEDLTPYTLRLERTIDVELPVGDYVWQGQTEILFLSTVWIDGQLSRDVIAFSAEGEERWRTELAAPPLQALKVGDALLVATANQDGAGHLVRLAPEDGTVLWNRALGDACVSLTAYQQQVWAAGAEGLYQIDTKTGETLSTIAELKAPSRVRAIAAYEASDRLHLTAAAGRDIITYEKTPDGWQERWRFRAAKPVMELHPVAWEPETAPHLLALGHSVAYDITPEGETHWRIDNNDLNRYGQPITCGEETTYAFGNVMNGVYVVNREGVVDQWDLPGGAFRLGPLPLPIPANPNFGITVADMTGDGQDDILARSTDKLFLFDCEGQMVARYDFGEQGENLVAQIRGAPHYRPLLTDDQVIVATAGRVNYLSLDESQDETE